MNLKHTFLSAVAAAGLSLTAIQAQAEELSVATFIPPQHHINSFFFDWFILRNLLNILLNLRVVWANVLSKLVVQIHYGTN